MRENIEWNQKRNQVGSFPKKVAIVFFASLLFGCATTGDSSQPGLFEALLGAAVTFSQGYTQGVNNFNNASGQGQANGQAWRDCVRGSIGPGGCESIGPGGGLSIGPGGGQSIGPGGGQSIGPGGGQSIGPGGGQSIGPGGGQSIGPGGGQSIGPGGGQSLDNPRGLNPNTMRPYESQSPKWYLR